MKQRIAETAKMLAIGVWDSPPIELLTAAAVVPGTIVASVWMLQLLAPLMTIVGCVAGVVFGVTGLVKVVWIWRFSARR